MELCSGIWKDPRQSANFYLWNLFDKLEATPVLWELTVKCFKCCFEVSKNMAKFYHLSLNVKTHFCKQSNNNKKSNTYGTDSRVTELANKRHSAIS